MVYKILIPYDGNSIGGSHWSSIELKQSVKNKNFDVVLGAHKEGALTNMLKEMDIPFINLPTLESCGLIRELPTLLRDVLALRRFILSQSIDLVHTQDGKMQVLWSLAAFFAAKKHIMHIRVPPPPKKSLGFYIALKLSSNVICVSNFVAKKITQDCSVIPNPISRTILERQSNSRAHLQLNPENSIGQFKIIWIANFSSRKRPEWVPEIAKRLVEKGHTNFQIQMVGAASDQVLFDKVKSTVDDLALGQFVAFLGWRNDIPNLISNSSLLLSTSKNEAYGRTLVEALLSEVPVLATNEGGNPEVLEGGKLGTLVEPSVDKLAETISSHIRNKADPRILSNHKRRVEERNSPNAHAEKVIGIYNSVLESN